MALVVGLSPCRAAGLHGYGERREGRQGTVPAAKQFQSDSASKEHTAHTSIVSPVLFRKQCNELTMADIVRDAKSS